MKSFKEMVTAALSGKKVTAKVASKTDLLREEISTASIIKILY